MDYIIVMLGLLLHGTAHGSVQLNNAWYVKSHDQVDNGSGTVSHEIVERILDVSDVVGSRIFDLWGKKTTIKIFYNFLNSIIEVWLTGSVQVSHKSLPPMKKVISFQSLLKLTPGKVFILAIRTPAWPIISLEEFKVSFKWLIIIIISIKRDSYITGKCGPDSRRWDRQQLNFECRCPSRSPSNSGCIFWEYL